MTSYSWPPASRAVIEQIGFTSSYQETHGYYADAVGVATVVLPAGWQERLMPLADEADIVRASGPRSCFVNTG